MPGAVPPELSQSDVRQRLQRFGTYVLYQDLDEDGYGTDAETIESCESLEGYASEDGDCDDTSTSVNPGEDEVCDGVDNNCDDEIDEDDAADATTWYVDSDGDGYGAGSESNTS